MYDTLYNKLLKSTDETRYKKLVATFDSSKNLNVLFPKKLIYELVLFGGGPGKVLFLGRVSNKWHPSGFAGDKFWLGLLP